MADDDLWPETLFKGVGVVAPVTVLREQASALTARTKGALRGTVDSATDGTNLVHDLDVFVPALDYTTSLVRLKHPVTRLYPALVQLVAGGAQPTGLGMANTEAALRAVLKRAFAHERVSKLVATLLAQVQST